MNEMLMHMRTVSNFFVKYTPISRIHKPFFIRKANLDINGYLTYIGHTL